ncbi:MAG: 3-phosphoglycerate dehydrogenase [Bacteroidales bacterium]|nr:3-phosphoglycerate dehydrogenase [Bacteroidales bacterium]
MKTVLVATEKPFAKGAVESIKKIITDAGFKFQLLEKYSSKEDLLKAVAEANALIIRSDIVDRDVVAAAPNLEIVVRAGAGYDNIDLSACSERKIVAMNTPGQNANAVAELVFGMLIYKIRNQFDGSTGTELRGKTMGIYGYGYIGRLVAQIAHGFGMEVAAYDPFVDKNLMDKDGVKWIDSVQHLFSSNQYVSLHIPANEQTKKSVGFELLSVMPQGACLINTARKEVIDEDGLLQMFEKRPDFIYVADVAPDNAAIIAEKYAGRFYFTPKKCGAQTHEANNNAGLAAARQIVDFFVKGDKTFQVNKF